MMFANPWWVRQIGSAQPHLRLFCLPYAGGGASVFRGWREHLPATVELAALQLPGRETRMREAAHAHLGSVLPPLIDAMRPLLDLDFVLFGHSMGALLAFELARSLRRLGLPGPRQLWVSGHRAPQLERQRRWLHTLPRDQFIDELRCLQGTSDEILEHPELMDFLEPRLRADFAVCETYQYHEEPPLDCAIGALAGESDELDGSMLSAWSQQTSTHCEQKRFRGGHFYLHDQRAALLEALNAGLAKLLVRPPSGQCKVAAHD